MQRRKDTDRYGDGDVPEVDYEPYEDNQVEPHPQTSGDNRSNPNHSSQSSGESFPRMLQQKIVIHRMPFMLEQF